MSGEYEAIIVHKTETDGRTLFNTYRCGHQHRSYLRAVQCAEKHNRKQVMGHTDWHAPRY